MKYANRAVGILLLASAMALGGCSRSRYDGVLRPDIYRGDRVGVEERRGTRVIKDKKAKGDNGKHKGQQKGKGKGKGKGNGKGHE